MSDEPNLFIPETIQTGEDSETDKPPALLLKKIFWIAFFSIVVSVGVFYSLLKYLNTAPEFFPSGQPIVIETGMSAKNISNMFEQEKIVRSSALLYYILVLLHDPTEIKASTYVFEQPLPTSEVARRLTEGDFDTDLVRFTHFEGERVEQIAERAAEILPNFSRQHFIEIAEPFEGRLYPDTYFIPEAYTEQELFELLNNTFTNTITPLDAKIASSSLSLEEIVILASIIEREANSSSSMKMVAGILENRLALGMALQADASIEYILDKPLAELTTDDLDIDSPYNTYLYPGLPPTPIGNPGLEAIMAVLEPTESDYYYYITDNAGEFHYAKTYAEHLRNIEKYLR